MGKYDIFIQGVFHSYNRQIDCLMKLLQVLASSAGNSEFMENFERFSSNGRHSRRIVARCQSNLRLKSGRSIAVLRPERLIGEWWICTCLSGKDVVDLMRAACVVANLEFGKDVRLDEAQWPNRIARPHPSLSHLLGLP